MFHWKSCNTCIGVYFTAIPIMSPFSVHKVKLVGRWPSCLTHSSSLDHDKWSDEGEQNREWALIICPWVNLNKTETNAIFMDGIPCELLYLGPFVKLSLVQSQSWSYSALHVWLFHIRINHFENDLAEDLRIQLTSENRGEHIEQLIPWLLGITDSSVHCHNSTSETQTLSGWMLVNRTQTNREYCHIYPLFAFRIVNRQVIQWSRFCSQYFIASRIRAESGLGSQ